MDNLKVGQDIRMRKYEKKIEDERRQIKICCLEKQKKRLKDIYGREREKYYNRNGWDIAGIDNMAKEKRDLCKKPRLREKIVQRQED